MNFNFTWNFQFNLQRFFSVFAVFFISFQQDHLFAVFSKHQIVPKSNRRSIQFLLFPVRFEGFWKQTIKTINAAKRVEKVSKNRKKNFANEDYNKKRSTPKKERALRTCFDKIQQNEAPYLKQQRGNEQTKTKEATIHTARKTNETQQQKKTRDRQRNDFPLNSNKNNTNNKPFTRHEYIRQ